MDGCAQGKHFPKSHRLRKRYEFQQINQLGRKYHTPHFLVFGLQEAASPRLGLTISRKVGVAVVRNRLKRYLREYFRTHRQRFLVIGSVSIIAKRGAARLDYPAVAAELNQLLNHLGK